ncbi:MAG TPA: hypothetical protein VOB72_15235 [Candidatus Dormibacteraeota bacterium]|nr:hypothetical protein [Candidatus Dormibacteraeota bacterium]
MFLKSHTELPVRFQTVSFELLRCPPSTIVEVALAVQRRGQRLLAEAGLDGFAGGFGQYPLIEVGEHSATERIVSRPFRLWAQEGPRTLWSLDCILDAAWLGPHRTYLGLSGQYELLFAVMGETVDRTLVHRVAETSAQQFVEITAKRLMG